MLSLSPWHLCSGVRCEHDINILLLGLSMNNKPAIIKGSAGPVMWTAPSPDCCNWHHGTWDIIQYTRGHRVEEGGKTSQTTDEDVWFEGFQFTVKVWISRFQESILIVSSVTERALSHSFTNSELGPRFYPCVSRSHVLDTGGLITQRNAACSPGRGCHRQIVYFDPL